LKLLSCLFVKHVKHQLLIIAIDKYLINHNLLSGENEMVSQSASDSIIKLKFEADKEDVTDDQMASIESVIHNLVYDNQDYFGEIEPAMNNKKKSMIKLKILIIIFFSCQIETLQSAALYFV